MFLISLIVLLLCLGAASGALWLVFSAVRAEGKRRLVVGARGVLSGVPDGTGISALCSDVWSCEQLENLLAVEYPRYEIVVVLDAQRRREAFATILERYFLIRVNYAGGGELPVVGVRGLYRSRRRCFRRLMLVDKAETSPEDDFNAAAGVATYEYLLPVHEGQLLVPGGIERLVIELSEQQAGELDLIQTVGGTPAALFSRRLVVQSGGFGRSLSRSFVRRRRILYGALFTLPVRKSRKGLAFTAAAGLLIAVGVALVAQWWLLLAVVLTAVLVWMALSYAAPLVGGICRFGECTCRKYIAR